MLNKEKTNTEVRYRIDYSNGEFTEKTFRNENEAKWYIYLEGDHVIKVTKLC